MPFSSLRTCLKVRLIPWVRLIRNSRVSVGRFLAQKCSSPPLDMAIRIDRLSFNETDQVGHLFRAVAERIGPGELLNLEVVNVQCKIDQDEWCCRTAALWHGRRSARCPRGYRTRRASGECLSGVGVITSFASIRLWSWLSQRTQHHRVLAEGNRLPVLVGRDVLNGQRGHRNPLIDVQYQLNIRNFCASDRNPSINADGYERRSHPNG